MKIGYPCINRSIGCTTNSTFRLVNLSEENFLQKTEKNINCLKSIITYNQKKELLFFRISSDLIPFAGYPLCNFKWQKIFKRKIEEIGFLIKESGMRISMHPDQFVLINSLKKDIFKKSILELQWQSDLLDIMKLDYSAKIQIHIGGSYGNKELSIKRFISRYLKIPEKIKRRIVIENDEKSYSLRDCLYVSRKTKIPVLFDVFHHSCLNNGETRREAVVLSQKTWKKKDGPLMVDYGSQEIGAKRGKHVEKINMKDFQSFVKETKGLDFDIMLEIKDKEKSATKALRFLKKEKII